MNSVIPPEVIGALTQIVVYFVATVFAWIGLAMTPRA